MFFLSRNSRIVLSKGSKTAGSRELFLFRITLFCFAKIAKWNTRKTTRFACHCHSGFYSNSGLVLISGSSSSSKPFTNT